MAKKAPKSKRTNADRLRHYKKVRAKIVRLGGKA